GRDGAEVAERGGAVVRDPGGTGAGGVLFREAVPGVKRWSQGFIVPRRLRQTCPAPRAEADAEGRGASVVDDQPDLAERGRIVDEAIGAGEAVGMLVTHTLDLAPHVLAAMLFSRLSKGWLHRTPLVTAILLDHAGLPDAPRRPGASRRIV